mgnify:CR=1 FL=1
MVNDLDRWPLSFYNHFFCLPYWIFSTLICLCLVFLIPVRLDLIKACDHITAGLGSKNSIMEESKAPDKYFEVLRMTCETRHQKMVALALDALHYLIEHGFLLGEKSASTSTSGDSNGTAPDTKEGPLTTGGTQTDSLVERIVETVSSCSDDANDAVQLQIIKVSTLSIMQSALPPSFAL